METQRFSDHRYEVLRSSHREDSFQDPNGSSHCQKNFHKILEKKFEAPHFDYTYPNHTRHLLSDQSLDVAHNYLASHGVDKELGPDLWSDLVNAKTPELMAFIFPDIDHRDFLWVAKFVSIIYAIDTKMDECEFNDSPDKACALVLGVTLALLWYNPVNERLLEHLKPLFDCIKTDESRALVKAFHEDLLHARNGTKNLVDVEMTAFASAFREVWMEYCEAVPTEFLMRQAYANQDFLMGCIIKANNVKAGCQTKKVEEYIALRRWTSCVPPFVICSDLFISRMQVPHIPNSLFYGSEMQRLLLAINDAVSWHNDIFSAYKEVIIAEDDHNLVSALCEELNCASYTEAGRIALQMVQDRIADMECACEQLKALAPPACQPAIERYIASCRNWISGTNQFHMTSARYKMPGTSK
ncbi:hypothetical protein R1sor_008338 [Riccia sorocarpa]|uniref:Terpene synthase n=1 Tax=Riccia sorocarpa TaxID=122646 RepID=A0ABD3HVY5_9MARC